MLCLVRAAAAKGAAAAALWAPAGRVAPHDAGAAHRRPPPPPRRAAAAAARLTAQYLDGLGGHRTEEADALGLRKKRARGARGGAPHARARARGMLLAKQWGTGAAAAPPRAAPRAWGWRGGGGCAKVAMCVERKYSVLID